MKQGIIQTYDISHKMQFVKHMNIEIKSILGIRKIPLCSNCKYFMKHKNLCTRQFNINYTNGKYEYMPIIIARLPYNCGHVGYYFETCE